MAIQDAAYLKTKFGDGGRPTGVDFADLIDSTVNTDLSAGFATLTSAVSANALAQNEDHDQVISLIASAVTNLNTSVLSVRQESAQDDVALYNTITSDLSGLRTLITTDLQAYTDDAVTLAKSTLLQLIDGILAAQNIIKTDLNNIASKVNAGVSKTVNLPDGFALRIVNGIVVEVISPYTPTPTPTPTITLTSGPTPTPTPEPTPTPSPTPSPTVRFKGKWIDKIYPYSSIVCHNDKLWNAASETGTDASDVPGFSKHWVFIEDTICPTPTPTPEPSPTLPADETNCSWEPKPYVYDRVACKDGKFYRVGTTLGTESDDVPGESVHWIYVKDFATPTPTPSPTPTPTQRYKGAWQSIVYDYTAMVKHLGFIWTATTKTDHNDEPGTSIHWELVGPAPTATPTPTPSQTQGITPTPTPTPTVIYFEGTWRPKHYRQHATVCYRDKIYEVIPPEGAESDDEPGNSNHWKHLRDEDCFPIEYRGEWKGIFYLNNTLICHNDKLYRATAPNGADAADEPGVSIHWEYVRDQICVTPTPTPTPTDGPTPTPTPTPTAKMSGMWEPRAYAYKEQVCHNNILWQVEPNHGTEPDDEPGSSVHWKYIMPRACAASAPIKPTGVTVYRKSLHVEWSYDNAWPASADTFEIKRSTISATTTAFDVIATVNAGSSKNTSYAWSTQDEGPCEVDTY